MKKNEFRKICLVFLLVIISLICITACAKKETLTMRAAEAEIEKFAQTAVTVEGGDVNSLTFSSSDESVATVDKNGIVTGVGAGRVEITAYNGERSGSTEITVFANSSFPKLNVGTTSLSIKKNTEYDIAADLSYKNVPVSAEIGMSSSDDAIASVQGLRIKANETGTCVITVSAVYAGEILSQDIDVVIRENESFILEEIGCPDLYLSDPEESGTYRTEIELKPLAFVDETEVTSAVVEYSAEPADLVRIEENVITGVKEGSSVITAKWTSPSGNIYTASVEVEVKKPVIRTDETRDFLHSSVTTLDLSNIDFIENISAELYNNDTLLTASDNGIFTFDCSKAEVGESYLYVKTNTFIYELPAVFYTHKITTKDEWIDYTKNGFKGGKDAAPTAEKLRDGYIILADDIDMNGEVFALNTFDSGKYQNANEAEAAKDRFYGVFDGRGHTIYNVKIGRQGFFGCVAPESVIKNVAFADVCIAEEVNWFIGVFSHFMYGTVDNCYVELNYMPDIKGVGGITRYLYGTIENSVVFIKQEDKSSNADTHGALCEEVRQNGRIANSYAVAEGEMKLNVKGNSGSGALFDGFQALSNNADTSGFNSSYWKKSNFTLTFYSRYEMAAESAKKQADVLSRVYEGVPLSINTNDFSYRAEGNAARYMTFSDNCLTVKGLTEGEIFVVTVHVSLKINMSETYISDDFIVVKPKEIKNQEVDLHRTSDKIIFEDSELAQTVKKVELNGVSEIPAIGGDGVLTVNTADIRHALGEQGLIITTESAVYLMPVKIITMCIYDAEDLFTYKTSYFKGGVNASANAANMRDGYVVLKADIDMKGERFSLNPNAYDTKTDSSQESNAHIWRFYGIFDGEGHVIDDIEIDLYGFFGHIAVNSIIRNLGITGATFNAGWNCGAFAEDSYGLIENCFVEIKEFPNGNNFGGFVKNLKGVLKNSIAYVSTADNTEAKLNHGVIAYTISGVGRLENVYGLRSDSQIAAVANTNNKIPVYDSMSALIDEGDFTCFGNNFILDEETLQFGSKIYNF